MVELSRPALAGLIVLALVALWTLYGVYVSMSVPEAQYEILEELENNVVVRSYPEEIWAQTTARNQNEAFGPLFRYISGDNDKSEKIEMTAPVVTKSAGEGILMAFVMPERFDSDNVPRPSSNEVEIEVVAPRTLAVIRFSWYMTEDKYENNLDLLKKTLDARGISTSGDPLMMQYDDPWTPPFLRRNEVALEVKV